MADTLTEETGTVGEPANRTETNDAQSESNANHKAHSSITNKPPGGSDGLKDALEDGAEDVVVGDEDTVIY